VEWWGHRDDIEEALASSTLVVLPSYREGLPKVLQEAAATERALVTTDVPGCRDVVRSGVNGLIVPARDPSALAEAIRRLLAEPALRRRMAAESRRLAEERFTEERIVAETLALYRRILETRGLELGA
jgi:glycosyltransferase involved in cell wall biosynthesis